VPKLDWAIAGASLLGGGSRNMQFSETQWKRFDRIASEAYFDLLFKQLEQEFSAIP
jgi:hypothetical protein